MLAQSPNLELQKANAIHVFIYKKLGTEKTYSMLPVKDTGLSWVLITLLVFGELSEIGMQGVNRS